MTCKLELPDSKEEFTIIVGEFFTTSVWSGGNVLDKVTLSRGEGVRLQLKCGADAEAGRDAINRAYSEILEAQYLGDTLTVWCKSGKLRVTITQL